MTRIPFRKSLLAFAFSVPFAALAWAEAPPCTANSAEDEFAKDPTWTVPLASAVKADTFKWLDARKPADAIRMQAESLWLEGKDDSPGADLLQRVVKTFALADPQARELVDFCSKPKWPARFRNSPSLLTKRRPPLSGTIYGCGLAVGYRLNGSTTTRSRSSPGLSRPMSSIRLLSCSIKPRRTNGSCTKSRASRSSRGCWSGSRSCPARYAQTARSCKPTSQPSKRNRSTTSTGGCEMSKGGSITLTPARKFAAWKTGLSPRSTS